MRCRVVYPRGTWGCGDSRDVSEDLRLFDEGQSWLLIGEASVSGTAAFLRQEVSICCHFDFSHEFLLTERPARVSALANGAQVSVALDFRNIIGPRLQCPSVAESVHGQP